jgi:pyrimidine operon attenuation protein / uracil phosphoribosyltransferase
MSLREKAQLMSESEVERTLVHLAHEIVDKTEAMQDVALVGIRRRGVHLAERLARKVRELSAVTVPVGTLDIQSYRDDLSKDAGKRAIVPSQIPFPVSDKDVILVDDVLFTGRSARAAMEALFDHGRPRRVRLCVLIDRGHRELPIEAAFVGKRVPTGPQDHIEVRLREEDPVEKVLMLESDAEEAKAAGRPPRSRPKR